MNQSEYMKERVDDQIAWYSNKSTQSQTRYKRWRLVEIAAAALIPFLTAYLDSPSYGAAVKFGIGTLGMLVAIISGLLALYKFQESWVEYRSTCEALKTEKYLFETQSPPYNTAEAFGNFVQKIESLISSENQKWTQYISAVSAQTNLPAPPAAPVATALPAALPAGGTSPETIAPVTAIATPEAAPVPPETPAQPIDPAAAATSPVEEEAPMCAPAMQFDPALTGAPTP